MPKTYSATRYIEIVLDGNSLEIEARLEFTIAPYVPAEGTSYASGGQPAECGHVEDVRCTGLRWTKKAADVADPDCPAWLSDWIESAVDLDSLYEPAIEDDKAEADAAAEYAYENAREDREYFVSCGLEN